MKLINLGKIDPIPYITVSLKSFLYNLLNFGLAKIRFLFELEKVFL